MAVTTDMIQGKMIKRYKRFLSDIELPSGEVITAHTPNTGSMRTCWEPGWKALLSKSSNPKRKLKYTLEKTHNGETWIGVNTALPNEIVANTIENLELLEFQGEFSLKREVKISDKSRIDIVLETKTGEKTYIEVKNVTLREQTPDGRSIASFPDAVSERGKKHLVELIDIAHRGERAVLFLLIQREDVEAFAPAEHIDPEYSDLLIAALENGVEILAYQCCLTESETIIERRLPLIFD